MKLNEKIVDSEVFYRELKKALSPVLEKIDRKKQALIESRCKVNDTQFYSAVFWTIYNFAENHRKLLTEDEAVLKYSNAAITIQEKNYIMDLMVFINSENFFEFQIDKKLFCKLLGIEVGTYNFLLSNNTYPSHPVFEDIEELLISLKQNSAETNSRNASAIERNLKTDAKFNGHEVTYVDNKKDGNSKALVINYSDNREVKKALKKFDFSAIESALKSEEVPPQANTTPAAQNPFEN